MTKNCRQCQIAFEITDEDLAFYDKLSPIFNEKKYQIPPPTLCSDCREQRRVSYRVERSLYNRKCDLCQKDIISIYSPGNSYTVYCLKCWWSDKWNPLEHGRAYDFNRSFFEQFHEFHKTVPQLAIQNDNGVKSDNCEYCQDFAFGKNCYLVIGSWYNRDSMYSTNCSHVVEIVDCEEVNTDCELVYFSLYCHRLYHCAFLQYCENCSDCFFGYDLKGCSYCLGCYGLRQKRFYIFNKPYSEEEYRKKINQFRSGSYAEWEKTKKYFLQWINQFPRQCTYLYQCENSNGNFLFHCKNSYGFSLDDAEDCKFFYRGDAPQFCYDVHQSGRPKWCYEGLTPDESYMTHFTTWCWRNKYLLYSDNCHNSCEYLFGCSGLKKAKYCILNKQYTKEEYEKLVPQIITSMQERGEWGEFFPMQYSPFGYNETLASELYPLTKEQAKQDGLSWREETKKDISPQTYQIPDDIQAVSDDIVKELLVCTACGKNYRVIPQEVAFYRKMDLPVPRHCYNCRHKERLTMMAPFKLWVRDCMKCGKQMKTIYASDRPDIVYCEECYLKVVY